MSRPSNASGIALLWISVGRAKPKSDRALRIRVSSIFENAANVVLSSCSVASAMVDRANFSAGQSQRPLSCQHTPNVRLRLARTRPQAPRVLSRDHTDLFQQTFGDLARLKMRAKTAGQGQSSEKTEDQVSTAHLLIDGWSSSFPGRGKRRGKVKPVLVVHGGAGRSSNLACPAHDSDDSLVSVRHHVKRPVRSPTGPPFLLLGLIGM